MNSGQTWHTDLPGRDPSQAKELAVESPTLHMCCVHWEPTRCLRVPGKHWVGHEPGQVLLLLVEDKLIVVTRVALVESERHCLEFLLALEWVEVYIEDARTGSVLAAVLKISLRTSGWSSCYH